MDEVNRREWPTEGNYGACLNTLNTNNLLHA